MMFENKSWWWLHLQLLTLTSTSTLTYNLFTELGTAQPQLVLILIISVPSIDVTKKFSDLDFCNLVSKLETETLGISLKIWNWDFILLVSKMRLRLWCLDWDPLVLWCQSQCQVQNLDISAIWILLLWLSTPTWCSPTSVEMFLDCLASTSSLVF